VKAVVYVGPDRIDVADIAEPRVLDPADAVVRVSLSAICGSDIHLLDGKTPGMRAGGVIGHEFVGTVESAGPEAKIAAGQRVLGSFLIACGACPRCRKDQYNHCEHRRALGLGTLTGDLDGAQAELVRVPVASVNLKTLDDALDDEQVLFGGDVLATGFYAAALAEAAPGKTVVIFGAGPIGLFTAMGIKRAGGRALVIDPDPKRVAFAEEIVPGDALLLEGKPDETIRRANDGRLCDVSVDAVGSTAAFKDALRCVVDGGIVVVIGVYGSERYELPMGVVWVRGLDLRFGGMANVQAHWDDALAAVASGEVDPAKLITHRLPLEEAQQGYEVFRAREAMKVVLKP
jgi:2-desacetyl-2-hydroxyethyl bacteriochlorophyllide A dehydrogenase